MTNHSTTHERFSGGTGVLDAIRELDEPCRKDHLAQFRLGLETLGGQVAVQLDRLDLGTATGRESYAAWLETQCDQYCAQFLAGLADCLEASNPGISAAIPVGAVTMAEIAKFMSGAGGLSGGGLAGMAAAALTVNNVTNGILWWKTATEITLATKIAAAIGLSVTAASTLLTVGLAVPVGIVGWKMSKAGAAILLRRSARRQFHRQVKPGLAAWAKELLQLKG